MTLPQLVKPANQGPRADLASVPSLQLPGPRETPTVQQFRAAPARATHMVQFYEIDSCLCEDVVDYIGAGLVAGEPVVVIATALHCEAFADGLARAGHDVVAATASGRLSMLDAAETMGVFMVNGMPDRALFRTVVGAMLDRARAGNPAVTVRAYGEMVNLLWEQGDRPAAIALESLWNDLGAEQPFALLCAYVLRNFNGESDRAGFEAICAAHAHVLPAEAYSRLDTDAGRLREIAQLQQRAHALEQEIARRKELEDALLDALAREKQARMSAERTVRYNEMFAGMLGHDLRNPLSAIATTAHYLGHIASDPKVATGAARITSSSERMARMIDQLLDFTRIRIGDGLRLQRTRLDLMEICSRIRDELQAAHPGALIAIQSHGDTVGEWDYDRLLQVLSNLVGNAVHHGQEGCVVTIHSDGSDLAETVIDVHNAGMVHPEILPVLFEPFRGTPTTKQARGLGLGLYITQQIVHAHGGNIGVTSSQEEGTTFRVRLPRSPTSANLSIVN